ncbi:lipid droplet-associated hydrolase [Sesamum indicum]|uniref:Lipid droplet-associated hydrolase n=1 Tax=Sesamum indicum TaxID=4182 RepID=A0A6I9TAZ1_SESIN|nr:lipid droplet-associated hydrolase [Sesamum indicum]
MLLSLLTPITRTVSTSSRRFFLARRVNPQMGSESLSLIKKRKHANFRVINVSGFKTDLMEIPSHDPALHVLFIPGNPGVISFYTDFLELLYESLGGTASVTAIGHISHSEKNWESGRLFSLQEQIDHKISFIEQELQDAEVPIVLVGHSIGSYISLETFKRSQEKVVFCIGLYPFLALNTASKTQALIRRLAASPALCAAISFMGGVLGMLPAPISRRLVKKTIGKSWSSSAVEVLRTHVLQYHTIRNMLFMAMTEFQKLPEKTDSDFIRGKKNQIAFLFGLDDHWGPLHIHEEIRKQAPDARLEVEREGHTHSFSCTEAGSVWVAQHVSSLIKSYIQTAKIYQSRM